MVSIPKQVLHKVKIFNQNIVFAKVSLLFSTVLKFKITFLNFLLNLIKVNSEKNYVDIFLVVSHIVYVNQCERYETGPSGQLEPKVRLPSSEVWSSLTTGQLIFNTKEATL